MTGMALAAQKFVSLTTYKKHGDAVATPMWVGRDGDHLFVWTPADSAKIKRVRNDPRVTLVPCGRFGKPNNDAEPVAGTVPLTVILTAPVLVLITPRVPCVGLPKTAYVRLVLSISLPVTMMFVAVSSGVLTLWLFAIGASLTGLMITLAVELALSSPSEAV